MFQIKTGVYRHYKGGKYLVLGTAKHSDTLETVVVYVALYDNTTSAMWIRPLADFVEQVTVNGQTQPRFSYLSA